MAIGPTRHQTSEPLEEVLRYHEQSKHHPYRYARSLGYIDWATRPDPFRRFPGAPRLPMEHPPLDEEPSFDALFEPGAVSSQPLNRTTVSRLFYDSLALSAWKQVPGGEPWSLRVNPSSGDLHPTEGYLVAGPIADLSSEPAVYHYAPFDHALERRLVLPAEEWAAVAGQLPAGSVLVAFASIYWRESWKYGERGFRYCHHDVGHAIGAVTFAAAALGWRARLIDTVADQELAVLLGVHRQRGSEAEHPDCLLAVFPRKRRMEMPVVEPRLPKALLRRLVQAESAGTENRLSTGHHPWPIIDEVSEATRYEGRAAVEGEAVSAPEEPGGSAVAALSDRRVSARRIVRQRRSALDFDGRTSIDRETFYRLLAHVTPRFSPFPCRVLPWRAQVSLALFVHRVEGLEAGLYLLIRDPAHLPSLRSAARSEFLWRKPGGCPSYLDLYLLQATDLRDAARTVSCHQDIAADGVFSLGMLAEFQPTLQRYGPWSYRRLFWETGLIGQLLYLEAEAAGIRATGLGCFFDDAMHEVLGIQDRSWQSLYHFTIGWPVEDPRLRTIAPYAHLVSPLR